MADEFTFKLNNPLTEEEWDLIIDVDLDNTQSVTFHTKHGKDVEYVRVIRCKDCKHKPTGSGVNHDVTFPDRDYRCPCRCEDFWYSWIPDDDWFCGNGERISDGTD